MASACAFAPWSQPASAVNISEADTSRRARERSVGTIPFQQLTPAAQNKIRPVVQRPTLFRRMPVEKITCHPDIFLCLVRYPELVVNMWELMGATKLKVKRIGQYVLDSNDGAGTETQVELVYGTSKLHLMYADGIYSGPLFRRQLEGRSVLLLHSDYARNSRGEDIVTCTLDVFITLQNVGADLVARTLHPLVGKTADHNFAESARFVSQVSEQAEKNPAGMQRLTRRLNSVQPDVREFFAEAIRKSTGAPPLAADVEPDSRGSSGWSTESPVRQRRSVAQRR